MQHSKEMKFYFNIIKGASANQLPCTKVPVDEN